MSADALETRVGTALAARYLGCTRRHVHHLIHAGALEAWDMRVPGATRAHFVVTLASVRVLLLSRVKQSERTAPRAR